MRLSCNGCRVLRKGCSDSCSIRPCLEWIKTSDSQAHATVFLAKFYGRAGLMNLINAGQQHLRPTIFKSLLYEACGRIVNPINGSVGLLWSGSWQLCENAVAAVLSGAPVTRMETDAAETKSGPPLKVYDIRHVSKEENNVSGFGELHQVRTRRMFKRVGKGKKGRVAAASDESANRSPSHESSLSHQSEANAERESLPSAETNEAEHVTGDETTMDPGEGGGGLRISDGEIELDLTLGLEPFKPTEPKRRRVSIGAAEDASGVCKMELVNFDG